MLTINKTDNQQEIENYCKQNGLLPPNGLPGQYMGLYEGDSLCGLGALSLDGAKVYLNFIHTETDALTHGLAKALLNMADLRGVQTVYGANPDLETLYTRLRFTKEEGEFVLALAGYFTAGTAHES